MSNEEVVKDLKKQLEEECGSVKYDFTIKDDIDRYIEDIKKLIEQEGCLMTAPRISSNNQIISFDILLP